MASQMQHPYTFVELIVGHCLEEEAALHSLLKEQRPSQKGG